MKQYQIGFESMERDRPVDRIFIPVGEKHKHKGRVLTDIVKVISVEDV